MSQTSYICNNPPKWFAINSYASVVSYPCSPGVTTTSTVMRPLLKSYVQLVKKQTKTKKLHWTGSKDQDWKKNVTSTTATLVCKSYNTCTSSRCLVISITRLRKQLLFFPSFNLSALPGDHTPPALRQSAHSDRTLPEVPSPGCRDSVQTHQCICWVQGSPVTETKTMFGTVVCLPPTLSPTVSTAMS